MTIRMDPMILGANLFRLEAVLMDRRGVSGGLSRVFEVVDNEPPVGGRPMLYAWPTIKIHAMEETNQ